MMRRTVKVYEIAKGELPPTDRTVLAWGKYSGPRILDFKKKLKLFFWGECLMSPEYWCFIETLTED